MLSKEPVNPPSDEGRKQEDAAAAAIGPAFLAWLATQADASPELRELEAQRSEDLDRAIAEYRAARDGEQAS